MSNTMNVAETCVNRQYKDRLFKLVFKEKEDLLQLYNAINGTNYDNPEDIEVNTLEDAVYMGMKNDISFLLTDVLNLYEHQSTIELPYPQFVVFYNGTKETVISAVVEEFAVSEEEAMGYVEKFWR